VTALAQRGAALYAGGAQNWSHFDRGIPRYVNEHLRALHGAHPDIVRSVLLNPRQPLTGNLNWLLGSGLLSFNPEPSQPSRPTGATRPAVYHIMSPFELDTPIDLMWPQWARRPDVATVVTVYDLIPLIFPDHYLAEGRFSGEYMARVDLIRHVDGVLAISENTAADVVGRLKVDADRVHVVHAGATQTFGEMFASPADAAQHLARHLPRAKPGFILYVGGYEFRKNLGGMIAGYARMPAALRAEHQLVIACRMLPEHMEGLERRARELGVEPDQLYLTGYVSDNDLGALYHACRLFVFPSLYEGSGLPILEAMACGAPVAASNTSTGPELLGDQEATFDPSDPQAIADCLTGVMSSGVTLARLAERSRRRVLEYTWRRVADESLNAYERAIHVPSLRPRRRGRLTLVTPWLPEPSGIATYNLRLAAALGEHIDVDVIVKAPTTDYPEPQEAGVQLFTSADFATYRTLRQPDRVLYCMGNSRFHGYMYDMLRRHPGAVVLHDVRLAGFYGWRAGQVWPTDPVGAMTGWITNMYGTRIPLASFDGVPDWERQDALGIFMTRELQLWAEQCFVHSRLGQDVLELDRASEDPSVPISVLPFGMPFAAPEPRSGAAGGPPLIVSLGYVHGIKGMGVLIRAFGLVAAELPGARLVVAGPGGVAELAIWRTFANEHAPDAAIEIPGEVQAARWDELLRTADLAVQLRLSSNGEASATVADCLAAGLPTIVSDLGWTGELPHGVVARAPVDVSAEHLAAQMLELLSDPDRQAALSRAALAHARSSSFAEVATAYIDALELG
jgi:glycosyltransferase involved in cell wall biosynthesis